MSIKYRLFLTLLGATGAVVLCMFLLLQWSMDRGFLQYVNTVEQARLNNLAQALERAYAERGDWEFLGDDPEQWIWNAAFERDGLAAEESAVRSRRPVVPREHRRPRLSRLLLLDAARQPLVEPRQPRSDVELRPLRNGDQVIGYLGLQKRKRLTAIHELRFVEQQKLAMALAAGLIFLVSAGLSLPLANRLLRPIRELASATHRLAAGRYATRVPAGAADEMGRLARDFNLLAHTLEKNEEARRQWLADISHELRTPLAVLRGEIEAIEDGIRQATPEAVGSLHAEVLHLGRLVDDLHQLSLSDLGALTYRMEMVDLTRLLAEIIGLYRPEMARKGLALSGDLPRQEVPVFADRKRLRQLFGNLLDNACKYTDQGGRVEIRLERQGGEAAVHIADSTPGVSADELEKIFQRFYRVEGSRSRLTGGAGLGLAICRNIVEAHEGTLAAGPSPLGGVRLEIRLRLAEDRK